MSNPQSAMRNPQSATGAPTVRFVRRGVGVRNRGPHGAVCAPWGGSDMAQALLTAVVLGLAGLILTVVFGLGGGDIGRHISYGIYTTLVILLAHSMMMFYLI